MGEASDLGGVDTRPSLTAFEILYAGFVEESDKGCVGFCQHALCMVMGVSHWATGAYSRRAVRCFVGC